MLRRPLIGTGLLYTSTCLRLLDSSDSDAHMLGLATGNWNCAGRRSAELPQWRYDLSVSWKLDLNVRFPRPTLALLPDPPLGQR